MCGIVGFNWTDEELLRRMCSVIAHRGPDGEGFYFDNKISLGHRRLSIIDLSERGKQPMCNEDGTIWITFNGEIYNFQELRKELEKKGHKFKSNTDTEIIIHSYEEYGIDCLQKFNGMFAFCIYDKNKDLMFVVRDFFGIKPVYYYFKDNKFIFASEIKAIIEDKSIKREPNNKAIIEYLTFQNCLDEKTFFKDIFLLLPGEYLIYNNKKLERVKYYKEEYNYKSNPDVINNFLQLFENSIKNHLISDVPVGAYTSSGFDSSSVTYFASKYNKNMHTFTGKFREAGYYDETICVKELAKNIGVKQHDVIMSPENFIKDFEKIIYHLDEPKAGIPLLSEYYIAQYASKYVKVVLTGHGGDELFLGYPVYITYLMKKLSKENPLLFIKALTKLKGEEFLRSAYFFIYPLFDKEVSSGHFIIFNKKQRDRFLTNDFKEEIKDFNPLNTFNKVVDNNIDDLTRIQQIYFRTYLPSLLVVEDKMSMAHSIEGRVPICEKNLVNFAFSIKPEERLKNLTLKSIPKEAMKDKLPAIFYKQEKKGFPTPLSLWLRNELNDYVYNILINKKTEERNIFNIKEVKKLLDKHYSRKTDYLLDRVNAARIWSLLSIEMWFRVFIDEKEII